ncbi:hypothetical protein EI94DRAFT_1802401 [Lactarius quietus]|nr:hypothetical protein EI94DRAFT_1802401 [Lactarius quietus]
MPWCAHSSSTPAPAVLEIPDLIHLHDLYGLDVVHNDLVCAIDIVKPPKNAYDRTRLRNWAYRSGKTPVINRVPVMPLFDLLVMKTQGWWEHRTSPRKDFYEKKEADALLDRVKWVQIS